MSLADQNPESIRKVSSPLEPARRSQATSSSTNRAMPRAVLAAPYLCGASRSMVGEDGQGTRTSPLLGMGGCACQRPALSGCSNPPGGGSGDKMLDWGSG